MNRLLTIVSKDRPELYEYLRRCYSMQDGVQVILDRRKSNPPETRLDPAVGRSLERRNDPGGDAELIFREVGAPAKRVSSMPRLMFADRDWTKRGRLRLCPQSPSLPVPGLTP